MKMKPSKQVNIVSRTDFGSKAFNSVEVFDISPMKIPLWLVIFTLLVFTALIVISPLLFKTIALIILLALL